MSTTSASCSIAPDSRRSESCGILLGRCSTARESWESAIIGMRSSRARDLNDLDISEISWTRFVMEDPPLPALMSWR